MTRTLAARGRAGVLTGLIGALALVSAAGGLRLITIGLRPPEGPTLRPVNSAAPTTAEVLPKRHISSSIIKRSAPATLDIPALKVHTRVIRLGLNPDHTVELPPLVRDSPAGWYEKGVSPGEIGPAVMLGHVDSAADGPAVFYRLSRLRPGDRISVTRADHSVVVFAVRRLVEVAKADFPTSAVYGPTRSAELRLVTCGGQFDRSHASYRDNIIVFASLTSVTPSDG
jgi:sortase (surface protein transpeptidase)